MICPKCNSTHIGVELDSREIAGFKCNDCGQFIKKAKSSELVGFYLEKLAFYEPVAKTKRQPCRYCKENYYMGLGPTAVRYQKIEAKYCPMCGRELEESDRSW